MTVTMILAVAENGVIGKDNQLPWRLPADMRFFKATTTGHSIIMGRKTFDSLGRALPKRRNMVLTRDTEASFEGAEVFHSLGDAVKACVGEDEVFIIGGGMIYKKALELDMVDKIIMTRVHAEFEGDAYFEVPQGKEWLEVNREMHQADVKNAWNYSFVTLTRRRESPLETPA